MLRVTKDRKLKYVSLGISLNPANWDFSKNEPKATPSPCLTSTTC
ncbi:MAG: Arm DNA-binding domain-containing protein [Paraprevotella sp.]|nr:Arm DNA-binding domain-containing protein [Paraprevotella sp.]